jgi:hypothetical protein
MLLGMHITSTLVVQDISSFVFSAGRLHLESAPQLLMSHDYMQSLYIYSHSRIYNYKLVAVRNIIPMQEWAQTDNRTQIDNREYDRLHKLFT